MRTEESLREALEFFAERAEQLEPAAARTPVRRVRRSVVLAAVAATVAAAVVVPVALNGKDSPPPVTEKTTTPKPPPRWIHQQMSVEPSGITRTYSGPDQSTCRVDAHPVGSYNPAKLGKLRKKTTVNGRPADLIQVPVARPIEQPGFTEPGPTSTPTPAPPTHLMIAWSYRAGSWALANCWPDLVDLGEAEQLVQRFAESVDFGTLPQLTAPINFGYLPPGVRVESINATADFIEFALRKSPAEAITVSLNWPPQRHVYTGERTVRINGRAARVRVDGEVRIPFGTYDLVVNAKSSTGVDQKAMVLAIAKGIRVADPKDRSQWFPAKEIGLSPR